MSKQDIEKRLGFAAQGVKAEFAADKRTTAGALRKALKAKGITSADDLEWHGISPNDPDSTPYWLYEDGSMEKIKSARAGAKTSFAADKRTTAGALRKALKAKGITSAADLEWHGISAKDPDSTPYWLYEDGSMEKINASRHGVKAKMETPMRVALTPMHTRAEQGYENFISNLMKLGGITREQAQKAFKAFKDAKVLVTKEQYRGGGITVKHGAFMERDVIRRAAGLPEESSRPGAKAKFDTKVGSKGNKSAMIARNGPDADASWLAWVVQHHGEGQGESVLGTMRSYSTEARAKAAALRGLETSGLRGGFSRPGVKAKA